MRGINLKLMNYKDIKAKPAEEGASKLQVRWLITKEMGAYNFAMRIFETVSYTHLTLPTKRIV